MPRLAGGGPAPVASGPAYAPTLVLSGPEDLRTPYEQALAVAADYPTSHVLRIPVDGHSRIGTDNPECAFGAAVTFIAYGTSPTTCPAARRIPPTAPLPPLRFKHLKPRVSRGVRGRTVTAAELTLGDVFSVLSAATNTSRQGGLRGGTLSFDGRVARLSRYSYIRGVTLSGRISFASSAGGTLGGTVRLRPGPRLLFSFPRGRRAGAARRAGRATEGRLGEGARERSRERSAGAGVVTWSPHRGLD